MFDLIIRNAVIIDGSGQRGQIGDIGVKGEIIAGIGKLHSQAKYEIDACGLSACPGFVDVHGHGDMAVLSPEGLLPKVAQGVTTEIAGNCGFSVAPVRAESVELVMNYAGPVLGFEKDGVNWSGFGEYLSAVEKSRPIINFAALVAHGTIRINTMGFEARKPCEKELNIMKKALAQALEEGAFGLSSGLMYAPGVYADNEELTALAEIVRDCGGIYATHLRNEGDELECATAEALEIARRTNVAVHLSHHKAAGKKNWGKTAITMNMIKSAMKLGKRITCDRYPYEAGSTTLNIVLPPWVLDGGPDKAIQRLKSYEVRERIRKDINSGICGWSNIGKSCGWENIVVISTGSDNRALYGKSIGELSQMNQKDPVDYMCDLLIYERGEVTIADFQFSEEDIRAVFKEPFSMVGSDGLHSKGRPHPRLFGTFPRVLARYVRYEGLLTWEEAIRKMTYLPAKTFGIQGRGLIKEGYMADIVLFDPENIRDNATYADSERFPDGIEYVMVNGKIVMKNNHFTGVKAGHVLRENRKRVC